MTILGFTISGQKRAQGVQASLALAENSAAEKSASWRVAAIGPDQRREARYATCDVVEVALVHQPGLKLTGVLRDVSKNGLCIELAAPLPAGAHLKISLPERAVIFAVARYCRPSLNTFQVGAAIEGVYFTKNNLTEPDLYDSMNWTRCHALSRSIVAHHTSTVRHFDRPELRMSPVSDVLC